MGEVPYSSGNAGVQMLTRVAAAEWGQYGVRVNCVAPGMTATENLQAKLDSGGYSKAGVTDPGQAFARIPLRQVGTCGECGWVILFFASDFASYITGQTLAVDGGAAISGFTD